MVRKGLPQPTKLLRAQAHLGQDLVKERWPDFASAMDWDCDRAAIWMNPALMTSSLAAPFKTESDRGATKILGFGARHLQLQCYPPVKGGPSQHIQRQLTQ